jgi:putative oxidoreductase
MKKSTIIDLISAVFILLFMYTASSKLFEFQKFQGTLAASPLIGKSLAPIVAWALPITEIVICLLLFFPRTRRKGMWASLLLMIAFTGYIGYLAYFAPHKPCSCGGVLKDLSWKEHFVFNVGFTLLAALGLWLYRKQRLQNERAETQQVVFT